MPSGPVRVMATRPVAPAGAIARTVWLSTNVTCGDTMPSKSTCIPARNPRPVIVTSPPPVALMTSGVTRWIDGKTLSWTLGRKLATSGAISLSARALSSESATPVGRPAYATFGFENARPPDTGHRRTHRPSPLQNAPDPGNRWQRESPVPPSLARSCDSPMLWPVSCATVKSCKEETRFTLYAPPPPPRTGSANSTEKPDRRSRPPWSRRPSLRGRRRVHCAVSGPRRDTHRSGC